MKRPKAFLLVMAALCLIFCSIIYVQNKLTKLSLESRAAQSMTFLPQGDKIGPWLLGFKTPFADFLWIKTTIYFGGHLIGDNQFPWLISMIDIVTRLNPNFYPAYEFSGLLLPDLCKSPQAAKILLQRGISSNCDKKWKLYFYLGMLYYKHYKDYENAGRSIATAAQMPGAPTSKLLGVATAMISKTGNKQNALDFTYLLYRTSENPQIRLYLLKKLSTQTQQN